MAKRSRYSPETRERAIRLVYEQEQAHRSQCAAMASLAETVGCAPQTLPHWSTPRDGDGGTRAGVPDGRACARERVGTRWNARIGSGGARRKSCARRRVLGPGGARPPRDVMVAVIDTPRDA